MIFNQVFTFFFILSTTSLSISHSNGLERRSKHFSPMIRRQGGIGATTVGSNGSTSIPVDSAVIMSSSSTSPTDGGVGASPLGPVSSNSVTNSSSLGSANVVTSPNTGIGAKPLDNPGDETIGSDGKLSGTIPNATDGGIAAVSSSTTTTTTTTKATKASTTTESTKATKTDTTTKSTKTTSDRTTTTVKDRKTTTTTSSKATSTSSGNTILSCTVSMSSSTKSKSQKYAHQGYESCADKLKSSGVASGVSSGMALCYRTGYIDKIGKNFGSELTVWSVGKEIPSSILKAISLGLTSVDGQSFVTQSGSLSTPKNNNFHGNWSTIDLSGPAWSTSVDGNLMTLVASYHFSGGLPSNFKASNPNALVPTIDMYGLNSTDTVKVLGLLDTTSEKDVADGPWGMWEKVIGGHGSKRMTRMVRRGETGGFVDKALKKESTAKVDGKTGDSNGNVGGFKDKSLSQSSQSTSSSDKSASASTSSEVGKIGVKSGKISDYKNSGKDSNRGSSNNSGSGGLKVGDTVIIGDEVCKVISTDGSTSTTTTTTTTTKTTTTSTSTSTSTTKDKTTTTTKDRTTTTTTTTTTATTTTTTTTTSTTTAAPTTTTSDSSTTTTTTDSSTSTSGVGANVVGFVSSTSLAATTTTTTAITSASAEGAAVVGFTSMSGSQISSIAPGSTGATAAADTAPSASSTAFQLPGRQLQVLPIGLGVFGGISVIALVIVGVVTYERRKYRRQFRQRKMQEQISSAAGYGSTNRMTEARI